MRNKFGGLQLLLIVFLFFTVLAPLGTLLLKIEPSKMSELFSSPNFTRAIVNSVFYSAVATIISIFMGFICAWCVERVSLSYKKTFILILTLPMLIPSISHGMGLIILLGQNGVLTRLFNLTFNIYGALGIILGSVMYSFPVAFLMCSDVLKYENAAPYDAADILGIDKAHQFLSLTLPYLKKPFIAIVFAIFTLIVTDYGVPLMIGGNIITLPVMMFQEVIGLLDFGKGSIIALVLIVPAIVAFLIDLFNKEAATTNFVTQKFTPIHSTKITILSYIALALSVVFVLLPICSFGYLSIIKKYPMDMTLSITNIIKTINLGGAGYLINSLIIAAFVSLFGTFGSFLTAYLTARFKSKLSKILHLFTIVTLAIPGIVLGLSYVLFFNGSIIYGTLVILVLVNIIHFGASPYLMMYNTLGKLNKNLEAVGMTLGISVLSLMVKVILPQARQTMLEMFVYFFVNSMMTISAVAFLSTVANKPLSLMMTQFEANMMLECSAVVTVVILAVNVLAKIISFKLMEAN